jgi:hypothetical protein
MLEQKDFIIEVVDQALGEFRQEIMERHSRAAQRRLRSRVAARQRRGTDGESAD